MLWLLLAAETVDPVSAGAAGLGAAVLGGAAYLVRRYRQKRKIQTAQGEAVRVDPKALDKVVLQAATEQWAKEAGRKELKFDVRQRISATEQRAKRLLKAASLPEPQDLKLRVAAALKETQGMARA